VTDCVLAVDLGTSGPKVALVGVDGCLLDSDYEPTQLVLTPDDGVEQDPADWWHAITVAARRMLERRVVAADAVIGVCCTAQWMGTVPVDASGEHLMNALTWMDARGAALVPDVIGSRLAVQGYDLRKLRRWIKVAGGAPSRSGKDPVAHIRWIEVHRPDVHRATATYLEPKDYLNLRLTGRALTTVCCIASHWVTDNRDLARVDYDPELLALAGLDRSRLPDIVRAVDVVGPLLPAVAEELGVPAGIPVVGGTPDVQSATLGSGAVADFAAHLYLGTSSWIACHVPFKRTNVLTQVASLPSAVPDRYVMGDDQDTAGGCLVWLRDSVLWPDDSLDGGAAPSDAFARIDALAASVPAGSGGVIFTPWLNGERTPVDDHTARAAWVNQSLATTRAHQVRAVLEGVAYNTKWLLGATEQFARRRFEPLRAIGGGACSDLWCRIQADVLERTVQQVEEPQSANVRGAGFLGVVGLGRASFDSLARSVRITATYEPDPAPRATYRDLSRELRSLYARTKGIHRRLNA